MNSGTGTKSDMKLITEILFNDIQAKGPEAVAALLRALNDGITVPRVGRQEDPYRDGECPPRTGFTPDGIQNFASSATEGDKVTNGSDIVGVSNVSGEGGDTTDNSKFVTVGGVSGATGAGTSTSGTEDSFEDVVQGSGVGIGDSHIGGGGGIESGSHTSDNGWNGNSFKTNGGRSFVSDSFSIVDGADMEPDSNQDIVNLGFVVRDMFPAGADNVQLHPTVVTDILMNTEGYDADDADFEGAGNPNTPVTDVTDSSDESDD